ncbi:MAG: hypothetical protein IPL50_19390 [Chitinophagaceae bacterium]|nr:hypothetical protein [Chitinophagaceae bacterium]
MRFNLTLIPVIVAFAGIPETGRFGVTTPGNTVCGHDVGPSGIATASVPELKVELNAWEEELFSLTAGSPKHMVTDDGTTVGAGGV